MSDLRLILGTRLWSSWSMRPWLALRRTGAPFQETVIALRRGDDTRAEIAPLSPSGKVPALIDGDRTVWDSLAICEYLAERFPEARLWPAEAEARALGRSAAAEMHAGFPALRGELPMDLFARKDAELTEAGHRDIARIVALWRDLRGRFGAEGPFLLGAWSIADAFYAPVATRFRTYRIDLAAYGDDGPARAYASTLLSEPGLVEWERLARAESE